MVKDEGIFEAYYNCLRHKRNTYGAVKYFIGMEEDLLDLADSINERTYKPSISTAFVVTSPKPREVFAACFRDRIIHHYVALRLEPLFEEIFGERTFNCRKGKGVLFGVNMLRDDIKACSEGYTRDCWIMKMDLRGFFMSIDKKMLWGMLRDFIMERYHGEDKEDVLYLTEIIVLHEPEKNCVKRSPSSLWEKLPKNKSLFTCGEGLGLPIGNLSSQHFANFMLNSLDVFMEELGFLYHGRYVDDFYIIGNDKQKMLESVPKIREFLRERLHIELHPNKFYLQHYSKGVTFTGSIVKYGRIYPGKRMTGNFRSAIHAMNSAKTKRAAEKAAASINSYLGGIVHGDSFGLRYKNLKMLKPEVWKYYYVKGRMASIHRRKKIWNETPTSAETGGA